jgi:FkbM family methyltransferase
MNITDRYLNMIAGAAKPTVLEIGAADGADTSHYVQALLDLGKPYTYIAFEPEPNHQPTLKAHPLADRFKLIPCAIGDRTGMSRWYASIEHTLSGSVKKPVKHLTIWPQIKFAPPTAVPMSKLDFAMSELKVGPIDWIWCDVQGAEDLVLAGGQKALARTRYFYTEVWEQELYQGQIGREEIHRRLPGKWTLVEDYGHDVLFRNEEI